MIGLTNLKLLFFAREYTDSQKVDLIFSLLDGQAKEEIKYRPDIRQEPHAILDCLQSAFCNPESVTSLQQKFFERNQKRSEAIRQYSYALLNLYQIVIRKYHKAFPSKNLTLCKNIATGLNDSFLRKEAKRLLRNKPADFHKFRDDFIIFSEDKETLGKRPASPSHTNTINDELNLNTQPADSPTTEHLLKIIEAQQKQIDSLNGLIRDLGTNNRTSETRIVLQMCVTNAEK